MHIAAAAGFQPDCRDGLHAGVFESRSAVASDPDDPNTANGKIVYSFPDDGTIVRKLFQIDSNTGLITTRVALDREERDQYTLILEARDLGSPVQQTSRLLNVVVKDIDDHPPKFNRQKNSVPLSMEVEEELPIGSKIGEVIAIDRDIGENAVIDYAIICKFEISFSYY